MHAERKGGKLRRRAENMILLTPDRNEAENASVRNELRAVYS
jgi:hypothetical protein